MKSESVNPLTTDDECTCHATLAACYQLVQSVLKTGFVLAKGWDRGSHDMLCTWQLSWLAVERPWLALAGPFLFSTNGHRNRSSAFVGPPFLAL